MTKDTERLTPESVTAGLQLLHAGKNIVYYERIDSTNRAAKELAQKGAADGTVIIAEEQSAGRGRLDRSWVSPAYSNILCSFIFYPELKISDAFRLTMLASIAVVKAIKSICRIDARIKWPNDVYVGGKKVCGILTEIDSRDSALAYAVVGIGINVNCDFSKDPELKDTALSLRQASGDYVSRTAIFRALLAEIDIMYHDLMTTGAPDLQQEWEKHSLVLNQPVKIVSGDDILCGTARGITSEGHLLLLDNQGQTREIVCGDLSLRL